jgi:hypothetical protein
MTSQELSELIAIRRPKCKEIYRDLLDGIATEGDKSGKGGISTLGSFAPSYMYAFMIGHKLKKNALTDDCFISKSDKTFDIVPISNWKPSPIRDFIIMMLLNESEEYGVRWSDLDDADEEAIRVFALELVKRLEAYANVGFAYLKEKWDNERYEFNDPFVFVNFLQELTV